MDIQLYRKISEEIEDYQTGYRTYLHDILNKIRRGDFEIRNLYYAIKSLLIYDRVSYASVADEAIKTLINSQLKEGETIRVEDIFGEYSEDRTTTKFSEGGFPDKLRSGGKKILFKEVPSIDSTIYALQAIVEYSAEIQYWDKTLEESIKEGLKYLQLRDENGDGLLEQSTGEDWLHPLKRDGSLLYINTLYLKLLEDIYYLYLDKDKEYSEFIRSLYTKVYRKIYENFWFEDMYIEGINSAGASVLRASIDSSIASRPIILRESNRIETHLNTLYRRLYLHEHSLFLASEARVKVFTEDRRLYRISAPLQTAVYAFDTAKAGYHNLALKIMEKIFPQTKYKFILIGDDGTFKKIKTKEKTTEIVLLATYKVISGEVRGGEGASAGI